MAERVTAGGYEWERREEDGSVWARIVGAYSRVASPEEAALLDRVAALEQAVQVLGPLALENFGMALPSEKDAQEAERIAREHGWLTDEGWVWEQGDP